MSATLAIEDAHVALSGHPVLRGFTLELVPGQVRALIGLNGAGKTTALRVALGMLAPDAGRVFLHGQDIRWGPRRAWRTVGHLVEVPATYPELTARENIADTARLHGADPHEAARRAQGLAEALGMGDRLDTRVQRLSLGTRQKIGLISALSHEPTVAILDEPTNGLDPLAIVAFRNEVRRLAAAGRSILLTSHHFDELARIADHVDILHRGRIIDTVTPDGRDLEKVFFDRVVASDLADRELA
ncbi:ABC-2 type transport system ATP-binding protein [Kineosphaera limosa]|uniref:ABC transporter ATP-binding protein n=1 Tax=Kineosphaera limosa TaxID=111564 RepID=UPI0002E9DA4E|nr:ABC transporter ATP-binding protein [Kineosphaera limosa]NYE02572.1 ABC-2 type transport system ATP-binding protein [Kineosphaera limosa]